MISEKFQSSTGEKKWNALQEIRGVLNPIVAAIKDKKKFEKEFIDRWGEDFDSYYGRTIKSGGLKMQVDPGNKSNRQFNIDRFIWVLEALNIESGRENSMLKEWIDTLTEDKK